MKRFNKLTWIILFATILASCSTTKDKFKKSKDLNALLLLMNGAFDSAAQAKSDSSYFDISLHMNSIWKNKPGNWIYVEQAVTKNLSKPYRQRVYKVEQTGKKSFKSSVYTLKSPEKWVEKWKSPVDLEIFTENDIELKNGCEVLLELQPDGSFKGGTAGTGCESNLRGASYATSKVTINKSGLESWDQGFDAKGKQMWGAVKGPYQFIRH